jgi:hypothetical protein
MLNPRNHKFYLILLAVFQLNNLYSQTKADIETQIKIYFEQLQTANPKKPIDAFLNYYPIYQPYIFQASIADEKNESGALCKEYLVSEKMLILENIYILSTNCEANTLYNLVDINGKKIYDLIRNNCSPKELEKIDTINQNAINDLENSYNKWFQLVKEKGLEKTRKENITPISFSKYKWVKELGYLSGKKTDGEILEKYFEIAKDSSYLNYFISSQDLLRFYKAKTNNAIMYEVLILSLVNNQTSFTTNILNFKLQGKETDIYRVIKQLEADRNGNQLLQLLKQNNISIVLKI